MDTEEPIADTKADKKVGAPIREGLPPVAYWFAGAMLVAYGVALFILWGQVDTTDLRWTRRIYLLGGLEALAFAAAGAVFGAAVQRQSTKTEAKGRQQAEAQLDAQRDETAALAPEAEKGRALEALVRARADTPKSGASRPPSKRFGAAQTDEQDTPEDAVVAELVRVLDNFNAANPR